MPEEKKRRKKVTGSDATHRTGTFRGAVKPGTQNESIPATSTAATAATPTDPLKTLIENYMSKLSKGTLSEAVWGDSLAKQADAARSNFGLTSNDVPYLYLNLSSSSSAAGAGAMLLSSSGFHIKDGRGDSADVAWKDFTRIVIGIQQNMVLVGTVGIATKDNQALANLLKEIQNQVAK